MARERIVPESPLPDLQELVRGLDVPRDLTLVFEMGDRDHLHVWLLSEDFADLEDDGYHQLNRQIRRLLAPRTLLRITLLGLHTPREFEDSYNVQLDQLPQPGSGELDDGPYVLRRAA